MSIEVIQKYFPNLSSDQIDRFNALEREIREWNLKINVVSRKDMESLQVNHILHSLAIAKKFSFVVNTEILDFGTGGGFPGIPLAILRPDLKGVLADSTGKKIDAVKDFIDKLKLGNIVAENCLAAIATCINNPILIALVEVLNTALYTTDWLVARHVARDVKENHFFQQYFLVFHA